MRKQHTASCVWHAEVSFRDNCHDLLTAAPWNHDAIDAENRWVSEWAAEWLADGTATCYCEV